MVKRLANFSAREEATFVRAAVMPWCLELALLVTLAPVLFGCRERPPTRSVASGRVLYQGKPVDYGDIVFKPKSVDAGKWFAQGKISGGKYSLDAEHGPLAGQNLVQIYGYKMTGRKRLDIAGKSLSEKPQMINELLPYIPEKFNEASELTVEIKPGNNDNVDFSL